MPIKSKKVSLIFFVTVTLLLVGLAPLVLTGWLLSDKSGRELRSAENRYQIQLVQEKARQIEMFGQRFSSVVGSLTNGLELANTTTAIASAQTERTLGTLLRENPDLLALYVKAVNEESLTVFRAEFMNRGEVEAISEAASEMLGKGRIKIGDPKKLGSGQFVMSFTSKVNINGSEAAKIVAIASLQPVSQGRIGPADTVSPRSFFRYV
ncbi:MAG: hypothetical protein IPG22_21085 [Acidobacteria bacterium]|nr:hypothetical protein [Acidobacteriota bacterium]